MTQGRRIPIACTLEAAEQGSRIEEWRALMAHALAPPEDGRVRFRRDAEPEVRRLVAAEAACCAFFEFDVAVEDGHVILTVGAPPEAAPLVDALLSPPG